MMWRVVPGGMALAAAMYPLSDPDTWWHLAAGRLVLDGRFPLVNTLSYTYPDHPWRFTQWLFGTLAALAERLGGFPAVQIASGAFAAGTFLLVAGTIRRDVARARWSLVLPLVAIGVLCARFRFVPRGDLATLLGLAAVHYLWVARPGRLPLYVFLAACVWSNLHAGVVFGAIEIALFGCAAFLDRDRKSIRDALLCGIAFLAGSLANPFLHYNYLYLLENLRVARNFPFPIDELQPTFWWDYRFAFLAVLALLGLIPALARRRYRDVLLIAGSGAMGASAIRFVPFIAVLALPGIVKSFHDYRDLLAARRNAGPLVASLSVLVTAAALYVGSLEWRENPPGLGADLRRYPAGAADFILSRGFTGRMFNEFAQGGFLAWRLFPGQRVFIDGRGNAYPWDHFRQAAGYSRSAIAAVLDRYGIDFALVQRRPGSMDCGPAFAAMGWDLVHHEGSAFLFVRPGSPDASRAREDVFRVFVPGRNPESLVQAARENPSRAHSELARIEPRSVLEAGESNILGICAHAAGDTGLAIRFLETGLAAHPSDRLLRLNYAGVLEIAGRVGEATGQYRRVVDEDATSEEAGKARQRIEAIGRGFSPGTGIVR